MSHNRDSDLDQTPCSLRDLPPALNLYSSRPALLDQPAGIAHRLLEAELEREKRHIGHNQGALDATAHGGRVMDHHVQRYGKRIVKAENHHADRIADEYDVDAGTVQQPAYRVVVCRQ